MTLTTLVETVIIGISIGVAYSNLIDVEPVVPLPEPKWIMEYRMLPGDNMVACLSHREAEAWDQHPGSRRYDGHVLQYGSCLQI